MSAKTQLEAFIIFVAIIVAASLIAIGTTMVIEKIKASIIASQSQMINEPSEKIEVSKPNCFGTFLLS